MDNSRNALLEYRLAERARDGDRMALDELATRLRGPMFAVAYQVCHQYEDAQDAVASALYRICRHIGKLRDPARVRSFILQTTRREAYRIRQNRSQHFDLWDEAPARGSFSLLRLDIERTLTTLPAHQARAISLFYFEGFTVEQIAQELVRPAGTIKYWLHRGRAHLHSTLEGYTPMNEPLPTLPAIAAILHTELPSETVEEMIRILRSTGWEQVLVLNAPAEFLQSEPGTEAGKTQLILRRLLSICRFVVLDEWIGGHSAFALSALLRAGSEGKDMMLMMLADGTRSEPESNAAAMAAYIAGFDLLLMKPFDTEDMAGCARLAKEHISK